MLLFLNYLNVRTKGARLLSVFDQVVRTFWIIKNLFVCVLTTNPVVLQTNKQCNNLTITATFTINNNVGFRSRSSEFVGIRFNF